ncbi:MAG: substrate-binding domain-containing protein [Pseudomonadota bacterium]
MIKPIKALSLLILFAVSSLLFSTIYAMDNDKHILRLATTTSTDNSGLLKYLLPTFEKQSGYKVHVIAVGTGKALRMGKDGDVDVVLVHAPGAEQKFVDSGFGEKRFKVMYNDFVLVGPANDPANIKGAKTIAEAMANIANNKQLFISRGDDSGTHKKERKLWQAANVKPGGEWYREAGQGMGKVLQIASELNAYTMTDRGTWLSVKSKSALQIQFQGDEQLFNPYGIIAVNPKRHPDVNHAAALALIEWITSKLGQKLIYDFAIDGNQLFTPMVDTSFQHSVAGEIPVK